MAKPKATWFDAAVPKAMVDPAPKAIAAAEQASTPLVRLVESYTTEHDLESAILATGDPSSDPNEPPRPGPHGPQWLQSWEAAAWEGAFWYWARLHGDRQLIDSLESRLVAKTKRDAEMMVAINNKNVRPTGGGGPKSQRAALEAKLRKALVWRMFREKLAELKAHSVRIKLVAAGWFEHYSTERKEQHIDGLLKSVDEQPLRDIAARAVVDALAGDSEGHEVVYDDERHLAALPADQAADLLIRAENLRRRFGVTGPDGKKRLYPHRKNWQAISEYEPLTPEMVLAIADASKTEPVAEHKRSLGKFVKHLTQ